MIWFTSDLHFGHKNIIEYSNRPFDTIEEMDWHLVSEWRKIVRAEDQVYVLGDFSFHDAEKTSNILALLPGKKFLIKGNHDSRRRLKKVEGWEWVKDYDDSLKLEGRMTILCHFPFFSWRGRGTGSYHLHGHCHGLLSPDQRRMDVGVDLHDFKPVSSFHVITTLRDRPKPVGMSRDV